MTRVLITGVGQDGSYLAEQLIADGDEVWGLMRGHDNPRQEALHQLIPQLRFINGDLLDERSLHVAISAVEPDVVYNFAAISSPGLAWEQPILTAEVTGLGALRLFEAVWRQKPDTRIVQAASLATHGPYGAAKLFAQTVAADYRSRGLHISCAVFGGHHSPRRGKSFFARKVTSTAAAIKQGTANRLTLGALDRVQDWGMAPDFMAQMSRLACLDPDDYVMSTGDPHSAVEWVEQAFATVDLDWRDYVDYDQRSGNVTDVPSITAIPDPRLNWTPDCDFKGLIQWMVEADLA